jgi:O-antigen ligase
LPLAILHDSGLIGFVLFFIFIGGLLVNAWFCVRRLSKHQNMGQYESRIGAALLASVLSLMVSSLTIPSHSLAIFWVVIALLAQFIVLAKTRANNVNE